MVWSLKVKISDKRSGFSLVDVRAFENEQEGNLQPEFSLIG